MRRHLSLSPGLIALLLFPAAAAAQRTAAEAPYVPTPPQVVTAMLETAGVGPDDVVYDLGSGDGRIVIAAAAEFGARGVGVEIDGELVRLSRESARSAGVGDRVRFLENDLFLTDLREATVVTMYLLPIMTYRLQPKLMAELRPGSRIVAHAYDMSEWMPDREFQVDGRWVFFWVVPAPVAGDWVFSTEGAVNRTAVLEQRFQWVRGNITGGGSAEERIIEARLDGHYITILTSAHEAGREVSRRYTGTVNGDTIDGMVERRDELDAGAKVWRATRTVR